ncbi:hypothetical protein ACRAWD_03635 [Caulobacter segnis]
MRGMGGGHRTSGSALRAAAARSRGQPVRELDGRRGRRRLPRPFRRADGGLRQRRRDVSRALVELELRQDRGPAVLGAPRTLSRRLARPGGRPHHL